MKKGKLNVARRSMFASVFVGVAASVAISTLIIITVSLCVLNEYFEFDKIQYIALIGMLICAFIGALVSGKTTYENKILVCCISVGLYYLLTLGIGILLFDGVGGSALWGILACVIGCATGIYVVMKPKSRAVAKNRRKRSR